MAKRLGRSPAALLAILMAAAGETAVPGAQLHKRGGQSAIVAAFCLLGVLGGAVFLAMPVIIPALSAAFHLTDGQAGQFASIQLVFISLGCLSSLFITRYLNGRRIARFGLLILVLADSLSPFCPSYGSFLALRAVSGLCGGLMISLTTAALARMEHPDRNIGCYLFAQIAFSTLALFSLPRIDSVWGVKGIFLVLAAVEISAFAWIVRTVPPVMLVSDRSGRQRVSRLAWGYCLVLLVSILLFCLGVGAFWTYVGRIGAQAGLSASVVGRALSMAMVGGLCGAVLSIVLPARWGRVLPILAASVATLAGLVCSGHAPTAARYTLAAGLFSFGWYLFVPYQIAALGSIDRDGRPSLAVAAFSGIGLGLGPLCAARFLAHGVQVAALIAEAATLLAATSLLLVIGANLASLRRLPSVEN